MPAAEAVTSHLCIEESTGKVDEPLPPECRVPGIQGGGPEDPARVFLFVDGAIYVKVWWREDDTRSKAHTVSLVDMNLQAIPAVRKRSRWCCRKNDGVENSAAITRAVIGGREHDRWAAANRIGGLAVTAGEMVARTAND